MSMYMHVARGEGRVTVLGHSSVSVQGGVFFTHPNKSSVSIDTYIFCLVCLTLLASFFLPSPSLINHVHVYPVYQVYYEM